jgi:hypothetical protein
VLESVGYDKIVYEDFYSELYSLVANILQPDESGTLLTSEKLTEAFQQPESENDAFSSASTAHYSPASLFSFKFNRHVSQDDHRIFSCQLFDIAHSYPY